MMIMVMVAYATAALRKITPIPDIDLSWRLAKLNPEQREKYNCDKCDSFKPNRTHHCK